MQRRKCQPPPIPRHDRVNMGRAFPLCDEERTSSPPRARRRVLTVSAAGKGQNSGVGMASPFFEHDATEREKFKDVPSARGGTREESVVRKKTVLWGRSGLLAAEMQDKEVRRRELFKNGKRMTYRLSDVNRGS